MSLSLRLLASAVILAAVTGAVAAVTVRAPSEDPADADRTLESADEGAFASSPDVAVIAPLPAMSVHSRPVTSARLGDVARVRQEPPTRIRIPALGMDAPVRGVGVRNAEFDVIDDASTVGWYRYGPSPGEPGSAVLAAHVDTAREGRGVFFRLRTLEPGAEVEVEVAEGAIRTFTVERVEQHPKGELPTRELFARSGEPRLVLITCGGAFDRAARRYADNIVVTAWL